MTIDEAIRIADIGQAERDLKWGSTRLRTEFYMLCSTALRLAKYMNGAFGILCRDALHLAEKMEEGNSPCEPDTWQKRMQREYRETKER